MSDAYESDSEFENRIRSVEQYKERYSLRDLCPSLRVYREYILTHDQWQNMARVFSMASFHDHLLVYEKHALAAMYEQKIDYREHTDGFLLTLNEPLRSDLAEFLRLATLPFTNNPHGRAQFFDIMRSVFTNHPTIYSFDFRSRVLPPHHTVLKDVRQGRFRDPAELRTVYNQHVGPMCSSAIISVYDFQQFLQFVNLALLDQHLEDLTQALPPHPSVASAAAQAFLDSVINHTSPEPRMSLEPGEIGTSTGTNIDSSRESTPAVNNTPFLVNSVIVTDPPCPPVPPARTPSPPAYSPTVPGFSPTIPALEEIEPCTNATFASCCGARPHNVTYCSGIPQAVPVFIDDPTLHVTNHANNGPYPRRSRRLQGLPPHSSTRPLNITYKAFKVPVFKRHHRAGAVSVYIQSPVAESLRMYWNASLNAQPDLRPIISSSR
jgi:hypothetical protein